MNTKQRLMFIGTMTGGKNGIYKSMGQIIAELFRQDGYSVLITSSQANKIFRLMDALAEIILNTSRLDIVIIQVYSGLNFILVDLASWIAKIYKLPVILHVHGGMIPQHARKYPSWTTRVFNRAQQIVVPSNYLANELQQHGFQSVLIPNVIELQQYAFRCRVKPDPLIVWLRAFHQLYNPVLAPCTLALLTENFPGAKLIMVGPDKGDGSFELTQKVSKDLGIQSRIDFPGAVPKEKVPEALQTGDIFLNTTNIDNTPVSVLEAMACGLCVVSTNVGGLPYLLEDGVDALLVPPDDPQAMANAVHRVLTEPGLAEKLSTNARRKVEGFDWSAILPQWERLFTELAQNA